MSKETAKEPSKAIGAPAQAGLAALHEETETGFEGLSQADLSIPFIFLLQKLSPQCDKDDAKFIEGAEPGMFFDSSTGELMKELKLIPCYYKHSIVEWKPDRKGFVAAHEPGIEIGKPVNEKGVPITENGNLLADTRYFFCLRVGKDQDATPCILSLGSTQIKKARNWLTKMQSLKEDGPHGKFTPPMFSKVWKISSVMEKNDKGSWYGYKMDLEGSITAPELFALAKSSRASFKMTNVKPPVEEESSSVVDEKM